MSIDNSNSIGLMDLPELKNPTDAAVHANYQNEDYHLPLNNLMNYKGDYSKGPLTLVSPTDEFSYQSVLYRITDPSKLPFTMTGNTAATWINDSINFQSIGSNDTFKRLAAPNGFSLIGRVDSFISLRALQPSYEGEIVKLNAWNKDVKPYGQSSFGGGDFIARNATGVDDGGMIAVYDDNWYWERVADIDSVTIKDFGGIPDGQTLCDESVKNMFLWAYGSTAQSNTDSLETTVKTNKGMVRYGPGTFAQGNVDLTIYGRKQGVKFYGDLTSDYKNLKTTILLTAGSGFAITAMFLQCELAGFNLIGKYDSDTTDSCGFLNNVYAGAPQQVRARSFHIQNVGGRIFNVTDTMDTSFTQMYVEGGASTLVYNKWSGNTSGAWDHTTAVMLKDISIWNVKKNSVLFIPRCHQSEISNVWISGCDKPGNISQGDWKFSGVFQLEGNAEPFYAQNTHLTGFQPGVQSTGGISYDEGNDEIPSEWDDNSMGVPAYVTDPSWEKGRTFITPTGVEVYYGAVQSNYYASRNSIRLNGANTRWINLGQVYLPDVGNGCKIVIQGGGGYDSSNGVIDRVSSTSFGGGEATIRVQNKDTGNKNQIGWHAEDSSPIQDVIYTGSGQYLQIYVKIRPYTASLSVFVYTDSQARTDAGLHFKWDFNGTEVTDITTLTSPTTASKQWMIGDGGNNGFGLDMTNGNLILGITTPTMPSTTLEPIGIPLMLNQEQYYIPLVKGSS